MAGDEDNVAAAPRRMPTRQSEKQASTPSPRRSGRRPTPTKPSPSSSASCSTSQSTVKKAKPTSKAKASSKGFPPRPPPKSTPKSSAGPKKTHGSRSNAKSSASKKSASKALESPSESNSTKSPLDGFTCDEVGQIVEFIKNNPDVGRLQLRSTKQRVRLVQERSGRKTLRLPTIEEGPHTEMGLPPGLSLFYWNPDVNDFVRYIPIDAWKLDSFLNRMFLACCEQVDPDNEGYPLIANYVNTDDRVGLGDYLKRRFEKKYFLEESTRDRYYNRNFQADVVNTALERGYGARNMDMIKAELRNEIAKNGRDIGENNRAIYHNHQRINAHDNRISSVEQNQQEQGEEISSLHKKVEQLSSAQKAPASAGSGNDALMAPQALQYGARPSPSAGAAGVVGRAVPSPASDCTSDADADKKPAARSSTDTHTDKGNAPESVGAGFDCVGDVNTTTMTGFTMGVGASGSGQTAFFSLGSSQAGAGPSVAGSTTGAGNSGNRHDGAFSLGMPDTWSQTAGTSKSGFNMGAGSITTPSSCNPTAAATTNGCALSSFQPMLPGAASSAAGHAGGNVKSMDKTTPSSNRSDSKPSANATQGVTVAAGSPSCVKRLANATSPSSSTQGAKSGKRPKVAPQDNSTVPIADGASATAPPSVGAASGTRPTAPGSASAPPNVGATSGLSKRRIVRAIRPEGRTPAPTAATAGYFGPSYNPEAKPSSAGAALSSTSAMKPPPKPAPAPAP